MPSFTIYSVLVQWTLVRNIYMNNTNLAELYTIDSTNLAELYTINITNLAELKRRISPHHVSDRQRGNTTKIQ